MTTIQNVAQLAGVSVGSVSNYLNGKKMRPQTAEQIAAAIKRLNYKTNIFGKTLRANQSYSIGLIVNDISNVFTATISSKIESGMSDHGYTTLISDYRGDMEVLAQKVNFFTDRQVDALIIVLSESVMGELPWLQALSIPVLFVDNPPAPTVLTVVADNQQSVRAVCQKMFTLGHERVGFIGPPTDTYVGQTRYAGWQDAYQNIRREPKVSDQQLVGYGTESGYQAMQHLLTEKQVTAVFVASYYLSLGALKAIFERHLQLGHDIGFASFDDFDFSQIVFPTVTVVQQPVERMASYLIETLLAMLATQKGEWANGIKVFNSHIKYTNSIARKL